MAVSDSKKELVNAGMRNDGWMGEGRRTTTSATDAHAVSWLLMCLCAATWRAIRCTDVEASELSTINSVRREGVDSSLRKYAFLAAPAAAAAEVYNVPLSPLLEAGIESQAVRLTSGSSLQQLGMNLNEVSIPQGALLSASASSSPLLLIYRKIFNFTIYSLPASFAFAGPIVGIIAYAPHNFTIDDPTLPQLPVVFSSPSITATLPLTLFELPPSPASISCAFFALNGSISFSTPVTSPNVCISDTLGVDMALVLPVHDLPQHTPPAIVEGDLDVPGPGTSISGAKSNSAKHIWRPVLGAAFLALAGLGFCVAFAIASVGLAQKAKVIFLDRLSGNEEALQLSLIGVSRAPCAPALRTRPTLEMDMACF